MTRSIRGASSFFLALFLAMFLDAPLAVAQDRPEEGGHELQVWTGGGRSVPGGTKDTSVWNAGVRYGWILTAPHGPGFLNGRFELAVDAVPAFVVFQPANTVYGAGVNPVGLKWIFATRGHVAPYLELSGGTLFTTHEVPAGTSAINFTSGAAFGLYFLWRARVVGGCPVHAHFECRADRAESGSEHRAGAVGIWEVLREEVAGCALRSCGSGAEPVLSDSRRAPLGRGKASSPHKKVKN